MLIGLLQQSGGIAFGLDHILFPSRHPLSGTPG
jgi:hypothetical protein